MSGHEIDGCVVWMNSFLRYHAACVGGRHDEHGRAEGRRGRRAGRRVERELVERLAERRLGEPQLRRAAPAIVVVDAAGIGSLIAIRLIELDTKLSPPFGAVVRQSSDVMSQLSTWGASAARVLYPRTFMSLWSLPRSVTEAIISPREFCEIASPI